MKWKRFVICICLFSCSPASKFKQDKLLFQSSAITMRFKSVADMNDSYFVIKENNFFEFYRLLFDSVKNSSYPGRFSKNGDTLLLEFYDKKGRVILGNKAIVNEGKNKITFFK
ncbi:MAG: hypothetical protein H7258_02580 [Ferruginibacter sp.]|nr:hypothetical protein [Ferruginibacter sp.]